MTKHTYKPPLISVKPGKLSTTVTDGTDKSFGTWSNIPLSSKEALR